MTDTAALIASAREVLHAHATVGVVNLGKWTRGNLPALLDRLAELDAAANGTGLEFGVRIDVPGVESWVHPAADPAAARAFAGHYMDTAKRHDNPDQATPVQRPKFTEPVWVPIPEESTDA